jgi:uncharacterized protein (DUF952 family)
LPVAAPIGTLRRTGTELRWLGRDVAPWMVRRLRGRSSGDGITAKRPRMSPVASLFHIVAPRDWPDSGYYRPTSLAEQGFVHFSFADQVEGVANSLYRDAAELLVVEFDGAALGVEIRVEDSYGAGVAFPHGYGPVPVDAAVAVHRLSRTGDGGWRFSPAGAAVPASSDR